MVANHGVRGSPRMRPRKKQEPAATSSPLREDDRGHLRPDLGFLIAGGLLMALRGPDGRGLWRAVRHPDVPGDDRLRRAHQPRVIRGLAFCLLVGFSAAHKRRQHLQGCAIGNDGSPRRCVACSMTDAAAARILGYTDQSSVWSLPSLRVARSATRRWSSPPGRHLDHVPHRKEACCKVSRSTADFLLTPLISLRPTGFLAFVITSAP